MALFVVTVILLTIAQLMTFGLYVHQSATDLTETTALAEEKLEQIRLASYSDLVPGGSVDVDVAGFFDTPDIDGDGEADYTRRWEVTDLGDRMQIRVRAMSTLETVGSAKSATLVALVAQR